MNLEWSVETTWLMLTNLYPWCDQPIVLGLVAVIRVVAGHGVINNIIHKKATTLWFVRV